MAQADIDLAANSSSLVLRTANWDAGGYTDGLYLGQPRALAKVMARFDAAFDHLRSETTLPLARRVPRLEYATTSAKGWKAAHATPLLITGMAEHEGWPAVVRRAWPRTPGEPLGLLSRTRPTKLLAGA